MPAVIRRAFLCHSSIDHDLSARLAEDLTANGIEVWYAPWEILPGDSLRRKIDAGIDDCSFFLALLTPNSLQSEWVKTELDSALVNRIAGRCRLVPIVFGIDAAEVPATLRGIRFVRIDVYADGVREILGVCHDLSSKPPLGPPPVQVTNPLPQLGLSLRAQRLAVLLNQASELGMPEVTLVQPEVALDALQITEDELAMAADELEELRLVRVDRLSPIGKAGMTRMCPTSELFFATDPAVKGWEPSADACALAATLVNSGNDGSSLEQLAQMLSWEPRRANPAATYLVLNDYAKASGAIGTWPYAYLFLYQTPRTRRLALASLSASV